MAVISLFLLSMSFTASAMMPNDPDYYQQWHLGQMNLPAAWDYTQGSEQVVVAVLDTGVDITHPDLSRNIWVNMDEIGEDGIDNDGNGYVDDINGFDFLDGDADPVPRIDNGYSIDSFTHGTIVAGILGAVGNNNVGISGVAWNVKIMPLRVLDNYGTADIRPTIEAIKYAIKNGADVINLSFQGIEQSDEFKKALNDAYNAGIFISAAAGNGNGYNRGIDMDRFPFYPVCYRTFNSDEMVTGVGALGKNNVIAPFSNYGKECIDLMAPGEDIFSTQLFLGSNVDVLNVYYSGGWQGTSMAAPMVTGVAALIKSINKDFTPAQIYNFLIQGATNIDSINPLLPGKLGYGLVDAGKSIKAAYDYNAKNFSSTVVVPALTPVLQPVVSTDPAVAVKTYLRNGLVFGASSGNKPWVKIFNNFALDIKTFLAYAENFKGGVNVAVGDVNGDGQKEIITAPGNGGGPHIRIFDQEGNIISQFFAYSTKFSGGVNLAVGDVDADGVEDIITAPMGQYQPEIKIFDLLGEEKNNFLAYDVKFNGGVSVTTSDVNLDGTSEIVTAPSKGGGPHIRIFNQSGKVMGQFFADDKKYRGGIKVAAGDVDGDYHDEIVVSRLGVGEYLVNIYDVAGSFKNRFFSFGTEYASGINLAVGDYDFDGQLEIVTTKTNVFPTVKIFDNNGVIKTEFSAFSQDYKGGVNVAIID